MFFKKFVTFCLLLLCLEPTILRTLALPVEPWIGIPSLQIRPLSPDIVAAQFIEALSKDGSAECMKLALCTMKQETAPDEAHMLGKVILGLSSFEGSLKPYMGAFTSGKDDSACMEAYKCDKTPAEAMVLLNSAAQALQSTLQAIKSAEDRAVKVATVMASFETEDCFKRRICVFRRDSANLGRDAVNVKYQGSNIDDYIFVDEIMPFHFFFTNDNLPLLQPTIDAYKLGKSNGNCEKDIKCSIGDAEVQKNLEDATAAL